MLQLSNRRSFLSSLAGAAGGVTYALSGLPFPMIGTQGRIGLERVAAAQAAAKLPTLVQFVLIDKVQAALFQKIDGTPPPGAEAQAGVAQTESTFRQMGLTSLFGDALQELPANVALSLNNTWESGVNGHSLATATLGQGLGSVNAAFESLAGSTGILGPVGFKIQSDANDSGDAFQDKAGLPMQAFDSVDQLRRTVESSVAPLAELSKQRALVDRLDGLVASGGNVRDALGDLLVKAGNVSTELAAASQVADPIEAQVDAVIALSKAGLARNFMIAVPWDDTNSGGNLTNGGGRFGVDPFSATPRIAQALVKLHKEIPSLFCVSTSDGGRGADNGDRSAGFAFLTGPESVVKNGLIGGRFPGTDRLGNTFADAALSNGQSQPTTPGNWYATTLKAMGLSVEVPHVPQALV